MSLAARRHSAGRRQCPHVGPELQRLEALPRRWSRRCSRGSTLCLAQSARDGERYQRARRAEGRGHRQSQIRFAAARGCARGGRRLQGGDRRASGVGRGEHPSRRGRDRRRRPPPPCGAPSRPPHRHRSAPSRARAGHRRRCSRRGASRSRGGSAEEPLTPDGRDLRRRHARRTRAVLSGRAGRLHRRLAGPAWRAEPDRADPPRRGRAPRSARPQFRRRLCRARRGRRCAEAGRPTPPASPRPPRALLADPALRDAERRRGAGGAQRRSPARSTATWTALAPYLGSDAATGRSRSRRSRLERGARLLVAARTHRRCAGALAGLQALRAGRGLAHEPARHASARRCR